MGNRRGYAKKVSGVVLSFADETFLSWRDCYIPDFCMAVGACKVMVEIFVYVCLILTR